jgi:thioredoxin-related protein
MRRAHRPTLALTLAAALVAVILAAPARAVEWKTWNEGLAQARQTGRPLLVDVYTDWCGWCKRMDADVYAKSDVSAYLASHFVTARLNAESGAQAVYQGRNYTSRSLASSFDVSGYPTTIFFDAEGNHLANVPGYLPRERFLLLLRFIGDGHMARNERFEDFMKQSQGAQPAR